MPRDADVDGLVEEDLRPIVRSPNARRNAARPASVATWPPPPARRRCQRARPLERSPLPLLQRARSPRGSRAPVEAPRQRRDGREADCAADDARSRRCFEARWLLRARGRGAGTTPRSETRDAATAPRRARPGPAAVPAARLTIPSLSAELSRGDAKRPATAVAATNAVLDAVALRGALTATRTPTSPRR